MRGIREFSCMDERAIIAEKEKMASILNAEKIEERVSVFKMMADTNRVKIIEILTNYPELCVNDIAQLIDATIATTSHHLIVLKNNGLITSKKEGKHVFYMLNTKYIIQLLSSVELLRKHCPYNKSAK